MVTDHGATFLDAKRLLLMSSTWLLEETERSRTRLGDLSAVTAAFVVPDPRHILVLQ
jgi:hypothetical protein